MVLCSLVSTSAFACGGSSDQIAFISERDDVYEIFVMDADGTNVRQLNNVSQLTTNYYATPELSWSPDGEQIAFTTEHDDVYEIFVMDADGTNVRQLTTKSLAHFDPAWSPDGKQIAFGGRSIGVTGKPYGDGEIFVMDADGTNVRQLTTNSQPDSNPAWSPDGKQIAFTRRPYSDLEIFVMDADGTNVRQLTSNDYGDYDPAWSPDGKQIAFSSAFTSPPYHDGTRQIFVMDADGANVRQLTDSDYNDFTPTWSPDGKQIVFSSSRDECGCILLMDVDGTNVINTNQDGKDPTFKP